MRAPEFGQVLPAQDPRYSSKAAEIDLSKKNAATIRRTFDRYIEHARKAGRSNTRRARGARDRRHSSDVRAWAKARGIEVSERGRIPASVVSQYEEANE